MKTKWNRISCAFLVIVILCSFALPAAADTDLTQKTFAKYAKVLQGKGHSFRDGLPDVLEGKAVIAVYYDLNSEPLELSTKLLAEEGDYWMIPEEFLAKDIKDADWALLVYATPEEDSDWPIAVSCFAIDIKKGIYYDPFNVYSRDTYIGSEEHSYDLSGTFAGMDEFVLYQAWEEQNDGGSKKTGQSRSTAQTNWKYEEEEEEEEKIDSYYTQALEFLKQEKYYSAYEAFLESDYKDAYDQAQRCIKNWPKNGEVWRTPNGKGDPLDFTIQVNQDEDQAILVRFIRKGYPISYVFIGGTATVKIKLPAGTYTIKTGTGTNWFGLKEYFGRYGSYETEMIDGKKEIKLQGGNAYTYTINITEGEGNVRGQYENWEDFGKSN